MSEPSATTSDSNIDRRSIVARWTQFSLRKFFVWVVIAAIMISLCIKWAERSNDQREAVSKLEQHGIEVLYQFHHNRDRGSSESPKPNKPPLLVDLLGADCFYSPIEVRFTEGAGRYAWSSEYMKALQSLRSIKKLDIDERGFADSDLSYVRDLSNLEYLSLCQTSVTDIGFARIEDMDSLRFLQIAYCNVTESRIRQFADEHPQCMITYSNYETSLVIRPRNWEPPAHWPTQWRIFAESFNTTENEDSSSSQKD